MVLTSGTIGVRPAPGAALAASGAGAIEGLTRGLAVELAPIRVNAVRPGGMAHADVEQGCGAAT